MIRILLFVLPIALTQTTIDPAKIPKFQTTIAVSGPVYYQRTSFSASTLSSSVLATATTRNFASKSLTTANTVAANPLYKANAIAADTLASAAKSLSLTNAQVINGALGTYQFSPLVIN